MLDTFRDLPVHALVVHATVVLVPLAAVSIIALVLVPRWRDTYGLLVVGLSTVALGLVPVTTQAGYEFKKSLTETGQLGGEVLDKVNDHEMWGDRVIIPTAIMWVAFVAMMIASRRGQSRVTTVLGLVAAAAAVITIGFVVVTGEAGSTAVWNPTG